MKTFRTLLLACVLLPAVTACERPEAIVASESPRSDNGHTFGGGNRSPGGIAPAVSAGPGQETGSPTWPGEKATAAASTGAAADSASGEDGGHTFGGGN